MSFLQLTFDVDQNDIETCEDILNEAGALAISLEDAEDQPLFEPKPNEILIWKHTKLIALFDASINAEELNIFLKRHLAKPIFQTLKVELLENQDWVRASLDQFQAQYFGNRLWITPSWIELKDKKVEDAVVSLDPGLAFGTGTHPTTQLCLEWLATHPPIDSVVLDYGCGSGILGIAALKLGARSVWAVDYDPQALMSTRSNANLNAIDENTLFLSTPEHLNTDLNVDLILANILANPLMELAALFQRLLKPQGRIVLSGILTSQVEKLIQYYPWLNNISLSTREAWVCVSGSK